MRNWIIKSIKGTNNNISSHHHNNPGDQISRMDLISKIGLHNNNNNDHHHHNNQEDQLTNLNKLSTGRN